MGYRTFRRSADGLLVELFPEGQTDAEKARYPHKCPRCGGAAYIGLSEVDHFDKSKDCK